MKKQAGGTLVGLIVGVLIGLGIALAVAAYVTKAPMPFVNKGQSRIPQQDAAELEKNKTWNPNLPLSGKVEVKPPPSEEPRTEQPPVAADPLGDLAKSRSAAAGDAQIYFVQVGAYRTPEDAEAQRAKLALEGVDVNVFEGEEQSSGRKVFRVRVGPFEQKAEAEKMAKRLASNGLATVLVRGPR